MLLTGNLSRTLTRGGSDCYVKIEDVEKFDTRYNRVFQLYVNITETAICESDTSQTTL